MPEGAWVCSHCGRAQPGEDASQVAAPGQVAASPDSVGAGQPPAGGAEPISAAELDRGRTHYYLLYFGAAFLGLGLTYGGERAWLFLLPWFLCLAAFFWVFLKTAHRAGLSGATLAGIFVLLLIPLVGLVTLMLVDFRIADTVERESAKAAESRLSRLSYWSIIMAWLPPVGLPMALVALTQIARSRGRLKGRGLAITGVVLNALVLLCWLVIASN
jgi:hypothetical protein